jgi:hypothetical protein
MPYKVLIRTRSLTRALELSPGTLSYWRREGAIPEPASPGGQGRDALWSWDAALRIVGVAMLRRRYVKVETAGWIVDLAARYWSSLSEQQRQAGVLYFAVIGGWHGSNAFYDLAIPDFLDPDIVFREGRVSPRILIYTVEEPSTPKRRRLNIGGRPLFIIPFRKSDAVMRPVQGDSLMGPRRPPGVLYPVWVSPKTKLYYPIFSGQASGRLNYWIRWDWIYSRAEEIFEQGASRSRGGN